jgi:hypothetical protein
LQGSLEVCGTGAAAWTFRGRMLRLSGSRSSKRRGKRIMRKVFIGLAGLAVLAACSKAPANTQTPDSTAPQSAAAQSAAPAPAPAASAAPAAAAGPAISGRFVGNDKAATLTEVTAHPDDPFDGKPIIALVFTAKDQAGDKDAANDAPFGNFGDAIVIKIEPDGTVISADVVHSGLQSPGPVSIGGVFTIKNYQASNGQISGDLTTGGPTDVFDKKLDVDLTFHVKAP